MAEDPQNALPMSGALTFRFATIEDIPLIEELDRFGNSPTRDIHRDLEKYFGSVDPSVYEQTLILLAEVGQRVVGKAELMLAPPDPAQSHPLGYVKRVVVDPNCRGRGLARQMLQHLIAYAHEELHLKELDLHVWDGNQAALHLYQSLGFTVQHRELYLKLSLS